MRKDITILVIEDNEEIQEAISLIFEINWPEAGIVQAFTGSDGILRMKNKQQDLVILDLGLPDMDGLEVLKEIRSFSNIPVIILTVRGDEIDKIRGLELGADDYVIKPFTHREILSRMEVVLSRNRNVTYEQKSPAVPEVVPSNAVKIPEKEEVIYGSESPDRFKAVEQKPPATSGYVYKENVEGTISPAVSSASTAEQFKAQVQQPPSIFQDVTIDFQSGTVIRGGKTYKLTATEINLLKYMAENRGKLLPDNDILTNLWGEEYVNSSDYLRAYIIRLREKLEADPSNPQIIVSEHGGYKFTLPAV